MKLRSVTLIFILLLKLNGLISQPLTIQGKCNQPGALIRLIAYSDLLNPYGETIFKTFADENGTFKIQTEIDQTGPFEIAVDLERLLVVLHPGAKYDFTIQVQKDDEGNSYFDKNPPALVVNKAQDNGLLVSLENIDRIVNSFALDHFKELYQLRKYSLLDTLEVQLNQTLSSAQSDYVKHYAHYKTAALKMAVKRNGGKTIIRDYFYNRPVLFNMEPYMSLFGELFNEYLVHNKLINISQLADMHSGKYSDWRNILTADSLLENKSELAELIIIQSLKAFYFDLRFDKSVVLEFIKTTGNQSNSKIVSEIATNAIKDLSKLAAGTSAPTFSLLNDDDKRISLTDYQGKPVLLVFVKENCPSCEMLFQNLDEIRKSFENKFEIVVISKKRDGYYDKYLAGMGYEWESLSIGKEDLLLLEEFNIRTFPELIFITSKGNIGMAPIPLEEAPLRYYINRLLSND